MPESPELLSTFQLPFSFLCRLLNNRINQHQLHNPSLCGVILTEPGILSFYYHDERRAIFPPIRANSSSANQMCAKKPHVYQTKTCPQNLSRSIEMFKYCKNINSWIVTVFLSVEDPDQKWTEQFAQMFRSLGSYQASNKMWTMAKF